MREIAESFAIRLDMIWRSVLTLESLHLWQGLLSACVGALVIWWLFPKRFSHDLLGSISQNLAQNFSQSFSHNLSQTPAPESSPAQPQNLAPHPASALSTNAAQDSIRKSARDSVTPANLARPDFTLDFTLDSALDSTPDSNAESSQPAPAARYVWVALGALSCGALGAVAESSALLLWLLPLALVLLLLSAWDIHYYVVPDWQNLALLLLAALKSLAPLALGALYASSQDSISMGSFSAPTPLAPDVLESIDIAVLYDMLLGAGLIALVYMLGLMLLHKQLLGEGDIVFCASFSALFGFENMLLSIFWGCVVACAFALFVALRGRVLARICARFSREPIALVPLIPCMILGLCIGLGLGVLA